jgi:acyl carrier protein
MPPRLESLVSEILHIPADVIADELSVRSVESWDSLRHMELVAGIEHNYGVALSFEEIAGMDLVGDIRRMLDARGVTA